MKQSPSDYVITDFADLAAGGAAETGGVLDSRSLFAHSDKLAIAHNGEAYLLRVTRNGKLLLTK
jgi:hemin uptake protein HemP